MPLSWSSLALFHKIALPEYVARVANRTHILTKISQHENSTVHTALKLSVGLQSINSASRLYRVVPCLKLYVSHIPLKAFFYSSTALVGHRPPHFPGFVISLSWAWFARGCSARYSPASLKAASELVGKQIRASEGEFCWSLVPARWLVYYPSCKLAQYDWYGQKVHGDKTLKFFISSLRCRMMN